MSSIRSTGVVPVRLALVLAALWVGQAGCKQEPQGVSMQIGSKTFTLEVAADEETRRYGLMRRDSMAADHGMLFVFNREAPLGFWMKDTRIPLDIIYVDAKGRVVSVKQMKAYDRSSVPSDGPAQYAIELNLGAAEAAGVKAGMTLAMPAGLTAKD